MQFRSNSFADARIETATTDQAIDILGRMNIGHILVSNLVSFPDPDRLITWIVDRRTRHGARISTAVHDYYAACPSYHLMNSNGTFCGVPSVDQCAACLPDVRMPLAKLVGERTVPDWRRMWQALLISADEILCFSNSSIHLMQCAFPDLPPQKYRLRPHRVIAPPPTGKFNPDALRRPLRIGVPGLIDRNKGAVILRDMAQLIASRHADVRITVAGTISESMNADVVDVTGPYQVSALPDILAAQGVNVCFLPSICPETFSFVAQEIMLLGYPLAVFDIGAPAERVRDYPLGRVLPSMDPENALNQLIDFHRSLGAEHLTVVEQ